jgi:single-stranded-DNA-specific exonuclease
MPPAEAGRVQPDAAPVGGGRRWLVREIDRAPAEILARSLQISPLLAAILHQRGHQTPEAAQGFLDAPLSGLHDPLLMAGMRAAIDRLAAAVAHREPVIVCGDFDVDGVTGVALLVSGLRRAGAEAEYAIPRRLEHGYGLPVSLVEQAADRGIRVLVAVDYGISAHAAIARARERGVDVIVCDHHLPPPTLPPALAILNPRRPDCPYPFKELCGAGLAFKLLQGLFGSGASEEVWPLLDLVALATVADLVPLVGENRILARHGLARLAATGRPGLQALARVAGVALEAVHASHVAFGLAPRINAAGRLDDATVAVRLLLTADPDEARQIAVGLDRQNRERQDLEGAILTEALAQAEREHDLARDRAIVLASPAWHPGVIGIVAARLVERLGRPVALIGRLGEESRGSARSAAGWHIADALGRCADLLLNYGGHRAAAGFSLRPERIPAFRERFVQLAGEEIQKEDLVPTLRADAEVRLEYVDLSLADELARLAPYGTGNPEPVLVSRDVQVMRFPRRVGQKHLKMKVRQSPGTGPVVEAIGFNFGQYLEALEGPVAPWIELAYVPERNSWNGRETLQLRVKDLHIPGVRSA